MAIKAIETRYAGCRFRSRLEARWAVFFDAIGWTWEYEKEGYVIGGVPYLPDFWIPYFCGDGWGVWVEIKPAPLTDREHKLLAGLVRLTGHHGYAFCGNPWPGEYKVSVYQHHRLGEPTAIPLLRDGEIIEMDLMEDTRYQPVLTTQLRFKGGEDFPPPGDDEYQSRSGFVTRAFQAARSARFEHGEGKRQPRLT